MTQVCVFSQVNHVLSVIFLQNFEKGGAAPLVGLTHLRTGLRGRLQHGRLVGRGGVRSGVRGQTLLRGEAERRVRERRSKRRLKQVVEMRAQKEEDDGMSYCCRERIVLVDRLYVGVGHLCD